MPVNSRNAYEVNVSRPTLTIEVMVGQTGTPIVQVQSGKKPELDQPFCAAVVSAYRTHIYDPNVRDSGQHYLLNVPTIYVLSKNQQKQPGAARAALEDSISELWREWVSGRIADIDGAMKQEAKRGTSLFRVGLVAGLGLWLFYVLIDALDRSDAEEGVAVALISLIGSVAVVKGREEAYKYFSRRSEAELTSNLQMHEALLYARIKVVNQRCLNAQQPLVQTDAYAIR